MKRTLQLAVGAVIILACITQAFPNVPPPATRLDIPVDGTWKSSTGEIYVISGSGNTRRFTIQKKGGAAATAYIDYEGNSFRFASTTEYRCIIVDPDTIRVTDGTNTSTWKRVEGAPQRNTRQSR